MKKVAGAVVVDSRCISKRIGSGEDLSKTVVRESSHVAQGIGFGKRISTAIVDERGRVAREARQAARSGRCSNERPARQRPQR